MVRPGLPDSLPCADWVLREVRVAVRKVFRMSCARGTFPELAFPHCLKVAVTVLLHGNSFCRAPSRARCMAEVSSSYQEEQRRRAVLEAELERLARLPSSSLYASHRIKVVRRALELLSLASQVEFSWLNCLAFCFNFSDLLVNGNPPLCVPFLTATHRVANR